MSKKRNFKEGWSLLGRICLGRHWKEEDSHFFRISFTAFSPEHARKIALERLKAFSRREKKNAGKSKFVLNSVFLENGKREFSLRPKFGNNSLLFAKDPMLVFQRVGPLKP